MGAMSRPRPARKEPSESRRTDVLLEKLLADFKTFGEGLSAVRERLERIEPKVNQLAEDVELIKLISRKNADEMVALKGWVRKLSDDNDSLKLEIKLLRDDLKAFDKRLAAVEAK